MSSSIWTPAALSSSARAASGRCWRFVEAQHHVSTAKLTDSSQEQERLEALIEETKPVIPEECRHLRYLLFTPFRYGAPYPQGSRFRRAGLTLGVFYGSELVETAATETSFYRLLFFAESPATPWPANASEHTAFAVEYATGRAIDLSKPPFAAHRKTWTDPMDYTACQSLAEGARSEGIDLIKYESARTPASAINLALLTCRIFTKPGEVDRQTWRIHLSDKGARAICEFPKSILAFDRKAFAADPRIAGMAWER